MTKIDSLKALREEKKRLRLQLAICEEQLHDDLLWIKEELKPVNAASKLLSKFLFNKNSGFVNDSLGVGVAMLLKKVLLGKSSWITRLIVPMLIQKFSADYFAGHRPDILSAIKNLIHKFTHKEKQESNGHYDASTVETEY